MNHAYADGSHQGDVGGWGVVLLVPGRPDAYHRGVVAVSDNGACELLAVLEAVRHAPGGEPLTVHTDATCAAQAVRRGTLHPEQAELGAQVRREAQERGIRLQVRVGPRDARRMREAHQLASDARMGVEPALPERPEVRVRVRRFEGGTQAKLTFRRGGDTMKLLIPLPAESGVAPALLAVAALIDEAREGEHLLVRIESALAPILWANPHVAVHEEATRVMQAAQARAQARNVTLEFVVGAP